MEVVVAESITQGRQAVLIELGSRSPSSSAKTHIKPYSTMLERARRVAHAAAGEFSYAVIQAC